jgi:hypothetical protein
LNLFCIDGFNGKTKYDLVWHIFKFNKRCGNVNLNGVSGDIIKAIFPYSMYGEARVWANKWHKYSYLVNLKFVSMEKNISLLILLLQIKE